MTDDLKERLLEGVPARKQVFHEGMTFDLQGAYDLQQEAHAYITDLEARLAAAEAENTRLKRQVETLKTGWGIADRDRIKAEAGEDALAEAGRKAVAQLIEHGSDGYASGLDAALAAYEARRKG